MLLNLEISKILKFISMKDLDDVEINNLRKPYDMVQSISVHCGEHELRRGPTDPTILNRNKPFPMSRSDE